MSHKSIGNLGATVLLALGVFLYMQQDKKLEAVINASSKFLQREQRTICFALMSLESKSAVALISMLFALISLASKVVVVLISIQSNN